MINHSAVRPTHVIGPLGEALTMKTMPLPLTIRWIARRKAEVVAAVDGGLLTLDEVCDRYKMTIEEFGAWKRAVGNWGMRALYSTQSQHYRSLDERRDQPY
jgi:hypothetical protein